MPATRWTAVPQRAVAAYLRKSEAFARSMHSSLHDGNPSGAALAAIHCTISSCDALTVFHLGKRSRGQDHSEVLLLLEQARLPDWPTKMEQVSEVLGLKNAVEYEAREPTRDEAERLVKQAERILRWAQASLRPV